MPAFEPLRNYFDSAIQPIYEVANAAVPQAQDSILKLPPPDLDSNPGSDRPVSWPAPVAGIKDTILGDENSAFAMRNFWPTDHGLEIRRGYEVIHDFGELDDEPLGMVSHEASEEVLAFYPDRTHVYNIRTGAERALNLGFSEGTFLSHVTQRVELGSITVIVNGWDSMLIYNGTDLIPIARFLIDQDLHEEPQYLLTCEIEILWLYGGRIFFAHRSSNSAYYMSINTVPIDDDDVPQVSEFPMGNVFPERGRVRWGFSWSVDVGDNLNNRCVFVSSFGHFALYAGDPDLDFVLEGVYEGGVLMSNQAYVTVGGDAYMLLHHGFKSLSEIVRGRPGGGDPDSLERNSYDSLRRELRMQDTPRGYHVMGYLRRFDMIIMAHTRGGDSSNEAAVVAYNAKTKSWTTFTGWNIRALTTFGRNRLLFLNIAGKLCWAWRGRSDGWMPGVAGRNYTAYTRYTFSPGDSLSNRKTVTHVQGVWDSCDRVCPEYQMVGYRKKEELPDPDPCPPVGQVFWPDDPDDPDPDPESFSFASYDMPPVSVMGNISYKVGASLSVPGYRSRRFQFITLDGVVKNVPLFIGWNYEHEDGVVPHWLCYIATDADIEALLEAGEDVPDSSIPPANSVRGWRELIVQDSVWIGNSRGDIPGFDIPDVGVFDEVSAGDLWNSQAPSPYMGHSSGISVITAVYGQWLSYQGEFWVINPTHETRYMEPGDNTVYAGRSYVVYRPMSEVDQVRRQIDQSVSGDNQTGLRALGFYYYNIDDPGDDSDVASSILVGRWFSFVRRVSNSLFGVAQAWDWERQSQLSSPPANITPAQIPADYG